LEAQHQKEVDNLKEEVTRLTSLLEQALRDKSGKATHIAQPEPMLVNPFTPQNLGANKKGSQKGKMVKKDDLNKFITLEQRMRAFEGIRLYDPIKAVEMCLVPNVVILKKKIRVPEFVKYTGTQYPITHLEAYCNKMVEVVNDEKLLIHFFQDSLSDVALTWYMQLDNTKVKKWKDLVDAFMRQYKFNIDVGPDRLNLQDMKKDNKESIREYARR